MGKQESMDDWFQMAKDFAKAERELKIEQWVEVTIYYGYAEKQGMCSDYSTNADGEICDEWNFWSFSTYYTTSLYHIHDYVEEYDSYEEALNAGILEALKLI